MPFFLDKTIKLWKIFEKSIKVVSESNFPEGANPTAPITKSSIKLPKLIHHDTMIAAIPRKIYQNAHAYHINSISVNSDGETYLSADDLRINLWNLGISDQSFSKTSFFRDSSYTCCQLTISFNL
jgi:serine/threonine-protein phosphatase 2A regulatory subunit B